MLRCTFFLKSVSERQIEICIWETDRDMYLREREKEKERERDNRCTKISIEERSQSKYLWQTVWRSHTWPAGGEGTRLGEMTPTPLHLCSSIQKKYQWLCFPFRQRFNSQLTHYCILVLLNLDKKMNLQCQRRRFPSLYSSLEYDEKAEIINIIYMYR